jgi:phenylacetate-CoA ligase
MHRALSAFLATTALDRADAHRRRVLAAFQEKSRGDRLDDAALQSAQDAALAALLNHARRAVPFYREHLARAGEIRPEAARAMLASLPIIQRADLQRASEHFHAEGAGEVLMDATGGSSGTPLRFRVDRATQRARESSLYWSDSLAGWRYGERIAMLWGSDKDVKSAAQHARTQLRWWIDNRRWFNAFNMGEDRMAEFHAAMTRFAPHLIVAYAGSMEVYARFLEKCGWTPSYPARGIVCSAEVLTRTARETIERVFRKPVFNRYGNREFGAIAAECSAHEGLHVNEHDMIVEIDSADPEHVPGPLIVTYLHNRAMPFIRYNTGDLALRMPPRACACGRTTARLTSIVGRESDTVRTRGGRLIHGEYFTHLLYGARRVREFQFVQESLDRYRLLLVADGREAPEVEAGWRAAIHEEVGADARVEIAYVDAIPVLASGKRKFTVSKVG